MTEGDLVAAMKAKIPKLQEPGEYTVAEFARAMDLDTTSARLTLIRLEESGVASMRMGRATTAAGRTYTTRLYRLAPNNARGVSGALRAVGVADPKRGGRKR